MSGATLLSWSAGLALAALLAALGPALWRLWCGPAAADRLAGALLANGGAVGLLALAGLWTGSALLLDAALLLAVSGLLAIATLARRLPGTPTVGAQSGGTGHG